MRPVSGRGRLTIAILGSDFTKYGTLDRVKLQGSKTSTHHGSFQFPRNLLVQKIIGRSCFFQAIQRNSIIFWKMNFKKTLLKVFGCKVCMVSADHLGRWINKSLDPPKGWCFLRKSTKKNERNQILSHCLKLKKINWCLQKKQTHFCWEQIWFKRKNGPNKKLLFESLALTRKTRLAYLPWNESLSQPLEKENHLLSYLSEGCVLSSFPS